VDEGKVNFSIASSKILPVLIADSNTTAIAIAETLNLLQVSDTGELEKWIEEVIAKMPDKVAEYQKGKKGLIGLFVGEVKKLSKGKADPKMVTSLLEQALQK
jgi:aspartyl-tRNA(Asn)/glutamyl-tRNA(Gln) amidotransferase subunit B